MKTKEIIAKFIDKYKERGVFAKTIEMDGMTYEIMKFEETVSEFDVLLGCRVIVDKSEAFPFIKIY